VVPTGWEQRRALSRRRRGAAPARRRSCRGRGMARAAAWHGPRHGTGRGTAQERAASTCYPLRSPTVDLIDGNTRFAAHVPGAKSMGGGAKHANRLRAARKRALPAARPEKPAPLEVATAGRRSLGTAGGIANAGSRNRRPGHTANATARRGLSKVSPTPRRVVTPQHDTSGISHVPIAQSVGNVTSRDVRTADSTQDALRPAPG